MQIGLNIFATTQVLPEAGIILPQLVTNPAVSGDGLEGTSLTASQNDVWTYDNASATVSDRQYRLLIDGTEVVAPQSGVVVSIPLNTVGATYLMQLRAQVVEAPGIWSPWRTVSAGTVIGVPQLSAPGAAAEGEANYTGQVTTDDGSGTLYWAVTNSATPPDVGVLKAAESQPVTASGVQAVSGNGLSPETSYYIHFVQENEAGLDSDVMSSLAFTTNAPPVSEPAAFDVADWSISDLTSGGDAQVVVSALPDDGGSALKTLEYQIDAGPWTPFAAGSTGTYDLLDLFTDEVPADVRLRATNLFGPGPGSSPKSVTTTTAPVTTAPANTAAPVISGTTGLGDTLSVTNGTWTANPAITGYTYQWRRNGTNISGATAATYDIVAADDDAALSCVVTATNPIGSTSQASGNVGADDFATPANTTAPAISGATGLGDTLSVTNGTWTANPAITGYARQWRRNGAAIPGAIGTTYTVVVADDDATITCEITATNAIGSTAQVSSGRAIDDFSAPANTAAPVISGATGLGDTLSVTNGTWTANPAITGYTYQWRRNGTNISGATAATYDIVAADDDAALSCVVTATNPIGSTSQASGNVGADDFAAPVISGVPIISGTEEVGAVLSVAAASVTANPASTRSWQWERNGAPISGATSTTYTLLPADEAATLTVVQTETNAIGVDTAESAATGVITTPAAAGSITINAATYTEGSGGSGPNLNLTVSETDSTPSYMLMGATHPTGTSLSKTEIETGSGAAVDFFSTSATTIDALDDNISLDNSITDGCIAFFIRDSTGVPVESEIYQITGVNVDATAPVLSAPGASATGTTSADWSVTSDQAVGTIFAGIRFAADSALTASQLINGTGGAGVAFETDPNMTANSSNGGSFTGLTASTSYAVDMVAVDDWGNVSSVISSAAFATDAAPVGGDIAPFVSTHTFTGNSGSSGTYTISNVTLGASGEVYIGVTGNIASGSQSVSVTVDGVPATEVAFIASSSERNVCGFYKAAVTSATGTVVVTFNNNLGDGGAIYVWKADSALTTTDHTHTTATFPSTPYAANLDVDVSANGKVLAIGACIGGSSTSWDSFTGVTEIPGSQFDTDSGDPVVASEASELSAETSRTVSIGFNNPNPSFLAACAISLEAS